MSGNGNTSYNAQFSYENYFRQPPPGYGYHADSANAAKYPSYQYSQSSVPSESPTRNYTANIQPPPPSVPPPPPPPYVSYSPYPVTPPPSVNVRQYSNDYAATNGYRTINGYNARKRKLSMDAEQAKKNAKKKKRPLSQNIPTRKDWSVEEAKRALEVEKEFNKRHKSPSLIIKFPDLELNRDIVLKFHKKIDSVHFQQPSTPRFCFVTLSEGSQTEKVIEQLNKTKFGTGYLTAEYKRDREDDVSIGPEDIDPLTLYVGNLAQGVTVDDVYKAYPKHKRVDIGFAKKMKHTRYAFVCFRTVSDAIEAFQHTHATEMYSKSLIVRFRRLHGTVGMPGEPKPQNPSKKTTLEDSNTSLIDMDVDASETPSHRLRLKCEEVEERRRIQSYYSQALDEAIKKHRPIIKEEIKEEPVDSSDDSSEEEQYEPLPDIFYSDTREKNRTNSPPARKVNDKKPIEVRIKPEPPVSDFQQTVRIKTENNAPSILQPVIEHLHRPMIELKEEKEVKVSIVLNSEVTVKKEEEKSENLDNSDGSEEESYDFNSILENMKPRRINL